MSSLAVMLLATPVFGLALEPPAIEPLLNIASVSAAANLDRDRASGFALVALDEEGESGSDGDSDADAAEESDDSESSAADEQDVYVEEVKRRNSLAKIHRPLGIATWAAMTVTLALGFIQYYNLYGFFDDQGSNPCVQGDAVFGQGQCTGFPWPHALSAGVTTGLYAAAFTVSLMMPDPDDLANAKGEFAERVRMHKLLRWVHFSGMIAQIALGIVIANAFDRANDYDTLQTLGTIHLATGVVTYGALTWAGALMTF
jgi:hypothetical protein